MPCPYRHVGEPARPKRRGRNAWEWVRDWYDQDIRISERTGWKGPTHDAFTYPFKELDKIFSKEWPQEKLDGMDAGARFKLMQEGFGEANGTYPPADPKGEGGEERPFEAFWPPVKDQTFPGLYAPKDPVGSGGEQRPFRMFWEEAALTEEIQKFQNPMPATTPSGLTSQPGTGGGGGYNTMTELFRAARDVITPKSQPMERSAREASAPS